MPKKITLCPNRIFFSLFFDTGLLFPRIWAPRATFKAVLITLYMTKVLQCIKVYNKCIIAYNKNVDGTGNLSHIPHGQYEQELDHGCNEAIWRGKRALAWRGEFQSQEKAQTTTSDAH